MNIGIGIEAAHFPFLEYINSIFGTVQWKFEVKKKCSQIKGTEGKKSDLLRNSPVSPM
jgi:hypothetical protein